LIPRPYSVTCIKELWNKQLRFVFSLMRFEAIDGRRYHHYGLCSGWLASLTPGQQITVRNFTVLFDPDTMGI
uniref:SH3 domain-containing protein n=1 Tax=Gongylonema pulchrum TaxID=637853 RepID=A0A183DAZ0_9BILA